MYTFVRIIGQNKLVTTCMYAYLLDLDIVRYAMNGVGSLHLGHLPKTQLVTAAKQFDMRFA